MHHYNEDNLMAFLGQMTEEVDLSLYRPTASPLITGPNALLFSLLTVFRFAHGHLSLMDGSSVGAN